MTFMVLGLVVTMTVLSGQTRRADRALSKVESSLRDTLDERIGTDVALEIQRKYRFRVQCSSKA